MNAYIHERKENISCVSAVSGSAALNVFLDNHTAVSEERTGQILLQIPHVHDGIKTLHASQSRTLAVHHPTAGVNLPVQNHSAARHHREIHENRIHHHAEE